MEYISDRIALFLSRNSIINKEDEEVYAYGAALLLSYSLSLATFLIIGLASGQLMNTALFTLFFIGLRESAGGYHAGSRLRCYILSLAIYIAVIASILWVPHGVMQALFLPLLTGSNAVLLLTAPTQNLVNPKTGEELSKNKRKMCRWLLAMDVIATALWYQGVYTDMAVVLLNTVAVVAGLNLMNLYANYNSRRNYDVE